MKIHDWTFSDDDKHLDRIINNYINGVRKCSCVNGMIPVYGGKPYLCPNCSPKLKSEPE